MTNTIDGHDHSDECDGYCDSIEPEPDCTHEAGHRWTRRGCGGCDSNPGVWNEGGTTFLFKSRCVLCGCGRRERHYGWQRNPDQCDTIRYEPDAYEPDAEAVAEADRRVARSAAARLGWNRRRFAAKRWAEAFAPLARAAS